MRIVRLPLLMFVKNWKEYKKGNSMRNVVLARVDDRLMHGQEMTLWLPFSRANTIVIVDNGVAKDRFNQRILKALAPDGIKVEIYDVENGAEALKNDGETGEKIFILVKTPLTFEELIDKGVNIKEIGLGNMSKSGDRKSWYESLATTPDEVDSIRRMKKEKEINIYYQMIPDQTSNDLNSLL